MDSCFPCAKLYHQLDVKVEFLWHCPSCLFQGLPLLDVSDSSTSESVNIMYELSAVDPFTIDLLEIASSGVRIVHHNIHPKHVGALLLFFV